MIRVRIVHAENTAIGVVAVVGLVVLAYLFRAGRRTWQ